MFSAIFAMAISIYNFLFASLMGSTFKERIAAGGWGGNKLLNEKDLFVGEQLPLRVGSFGKGCNKKWQSCFF